MGQWKDNSVRGLAAVVGRCIDGNDHILMYVRWVWDHFYRPLSYTLVQILLQQS